MTEEATTTEAPAGERPEANDSVPVWVLIAAVTAIVALFGAGGAFLYLRGQAASARDAGLRERARLDAERIGSLDSQRSGLADALEGIMAADLVSAPEPAGSVRDGTCFGIVYEATGTASAPAIMVDWGQAFVGSYARSIARRQLGRGASQSFWFENREAKVQKLRLLPQANIVVVRLMDEPSVLTVPEFLRLASSPDTAAQVVRSGYWVRVSKGEAVALTQQYTVR